MALVLALAAASALAGCASQADGARLVGIRLTDFDIQPGRLEIPKPGPVLLEIRNDGETVHEFQITGPDDLDEETDEMEPGDGETLKLDLAAGTYRMICPLEDHEKRGMKGKIVVEK